MSALMLGLLIVIGYIVVGLVVARVDLPRMWKRHLQMAEDRTKGNYYLPWTDKEIRSHVEATFWAEAVLWPFAISVVVYCAIMNPVIDKTDPRRKDREIAALQATIARQEKDLGMNDTAYQPVDGISSQSLSSARHPGKTHSRSCGCSARDLALEFQRKVYSIDPRRKR